MRITWDSGPRPYNEGVSQGVLYPFDTPGVAWNGLISVTEAADQTQTAMYYDGVRYLTRGTSSPFKGSISAYTYPDELEDYIGTKDFFTGQKNRPFGFSYRTNEEIHLVYGVLLSPSQRPYSTMGSQTAAVAFQWNFTTQPQKIPGGKPSSHIVILLSEIDPAVLAELEIAIYGDDESDPELPSIADIIAIFEIPTVMTITVNPDGTFEADGPEAFVSTPTIGGEFTIDSPSLDTLDVTTYSVSNF
jgi:hypothetical protein